MHSDILMYDSHDCTLCSNITQNSFKIYQTSIVQEGLGKVHFASTSLLIYTRRTKFLWSFCNFRV